MSIYTTANLAGSAGKTTTSVSLAVLLAARGVRVRLIDLDPQANSSRWTGYADPGDSPTIADVLAESATIADAERPARIPAYLEDDGTIEFDDTSIIENLTVVPAIRSSLDEFVARLPVIRGGVTRLRRALTDAATADVTLIDAPGSSNALTLSAILATQAFPDVDDTSGVITCTLAQPKEIEGIADLQAEIAGINEERNTTCQLRGIVVCSVPANRARLYGENIDDLTAGYGELVAPSVRHSVTVPEAYSFYTPVPLYGRARRVTEDYADVLDHFIKTGLFPEARTA
ncbi:MAG: ParA family protein [Gordonia polyisoprenivorans]|nr:ParA family protein [Gordonia polyisoprenivorans]